MREIDKAKETTSAKAGGTSGSACGYNNCEEANKMSSGGERHEEEGKVGMG